MTDLRAAQIAAVRKVMGWGAQPDEFNELACAETAAEVVDAVLTATGEPVVREEFEWSVLHVSTVRLGALSETLARSIYIEREFAVSLDKRLVRHYPDGSRLLAPWVAVESKNP